MAGNVNNVRRSNRTFQPRDRPGSVPFFFQINIGYLQDQPEEAPKPRLMTMEMDSDEDYDPNDDKYQTEGGECHMVNSRNPVMKLY